MNTMTVKQTLFSVVSEILAGCEGVQQVNAQNIQTLLSESTQQIAYSIEQMTRDLETSMGFSSAYASLTAQQIAPKPTLYSFLIFQATQASRSSTISSRQQRYNLVAPEFTCFLFDQNIDQYNVGYREDNAVQRTIDQAAQCLAHDPDFYLRGILQTLDLCWSGLARATELPQDLRAYGLLVPYIHWLRTHRATRSDIADVLYTVADVLTNEHLAQIAFAGGIYTNEHFQRYSDFVDSALGNVDSHRVENAEQTVARAMLRGQGYLMVSVSHYLLQQCDSRDPNTASEAHTVRQLLQTNPQLVELVRLAEALVRVGDDAGDLAIDLDTHAPNIFLSTATLQQFFLQLALSDNDFTELERLLKLGRQSNKDATRAMDTLSGIEKLYYDVFLDNRYAYSKDFQAFVRVIRAVVYGAKVNAVYNDRIAANIGQLLGARTPAQTVH